MNTRNQLICAWAGPLCLVLFIIGMWPLAQFFPPLSPSDSANDIATIYRANPVAIRFGILLMLTSAAFQGPFAAAISIQMRRIEGKNPIMSYVQLGAGAVAMLVVSIPMMLFAATAFRPERMPEITQALNDVSWLLFLMPFGPAGIQSLAIGLAVLSDKNVKPIFPRWVAYYNFWVAFLYLPGGFIMFFKTGPFAWNGFIGFWIPAITYFIWLVLMCPVLIRAIRAEAAEAENPG